jgi:site-specific DNA recombinase
MKPPKVAVREIRVVALYARISQEDKDPVTGELLTESVGDQLTNLRGRAAERWPGAILREYVDNDLSASEFSNKPRKAWLRLLADLLSGEIDALFTVHSDRLTRRVDEAFEFRQAIAAHDAEVWDLRGKKDILADGGTMFYLEAVMASKSSYDTSRRIRDKNSVRREAGRHHASRPAFGFTDATYTEHVPAERDLLLACWKGVKRGETLGDCQRAFNQSGFLSPYTGKPYTRAAIYRMLRNPVYAGYVVHKGEIVRTSGNIKRMVTPEYWAVVQDKLKRNSRANDTRPDKDAPRSTARVHLLKGFLRCGNPACGMVLIAGKDNGRRVWRCPPKSQGGCCGISRSYDLVARVVDGYVREALTMARVEEIASAQDDPRRRALEAEIAELEARAADLARRYADTENPLSPDDYFPMVTGVRDGITTRRRDLAAMVRTAERALPPDALATWDDDRPETLGVRREMLARLIDYVVILPTRNLGRRGAPPESVRIMKRRAPVTAEVTGRDAPPTAEVGDAMSARDIAS